MWDDLPDRFTTAACTALPALGADLLGQVGDGLLGGHSDALILDRVPLSGQSETVGTLLSLLAAEHVSREAAGTYLCGLADGYRTAGAVSTDLVATGPSHSRVPLRDTRQALLELINGARAELVLTTYSAKPVHEVLDALCSARSRGVRVNVVVETLAGAGSALQGADPVMAFASVPGVRLWHWPSDQRGSLDAKMHAKLALADRSVLLATSANLTTSGLTSNFEIGILVRGGEAPGRATDHLTGLMAAGVLQRL